MEVVADEPGFYRCYNRVVKGNSLCGWSETFQRDFSYRKKWIRQGLRKLCRYMCVEHADYAILSTNLHLIARIRPDVARKLSDRQVAARQVAARWCHLCITAGLPPDYRKVSGEYPTLDQRIANVLADEELVAEYRRRLSDISWMCERR